MPYTQLKSDLVGATEAERIAKSGLSEQLVRACQEGSPEAQRELYECYKGKVYSLALYLTGDVELAHDLTQEIFVKALRDQHVPQCAAGAAHATRGGH